MAEVPFSKYEGIGNDFVVLEGLDESRVSPDVAAKLCDRRFGIGGDGVLLVLPPRSSGAAARMKVLNADGSVPEMCGNGIRCVAIHVAAARGIREGEIVFDTDAGVRSCFVEEGRVTVDMGVVRVLGDETVDVAGEPVVVHVADAGNPHAILFGDYSRGDVDRIGPRIATHSAFPNGTNVEFSHVRDDGGIDLIVWERGVGVTMACGTGACATVAVACERHLAKREERVAVRLPGGVLEITIHRDGRATMRGSARRVFTGAVAI